MVSASPITIIPVHAPIDTGIRDAAGGTDPAFARAGEAKTVYDHSRDVYRRLRHLLAPDARHPGYPQRTLYAAAHEIVVEMAKEGGRTRRPAQRLFSRTRHLFAPHAQLVAYRLIERELGAVRGQLLEEARRGGRGNLLTCAATTRRSKPCQREPLRGSLYCPSHRHLEDAAPPAAASSAPPRIGGRLATAAFPSAI